MIFFFNFLHSIADLWKGLKILTQLLSKNDLRRHQEEVVPTTGVPMIAS